MANIARMNEDQKKWAEWARIAVAFKHTESDQSSQLACLACGGHYVDHADWDLEASYVTARDVLNGVWAMDDQCVHCNADLLVLAHRMVGLNTQPHNCWSGEGECQPSGI